MTIRVMGHTHAYPPSNNAGGPLTMHSLLMAGKRRRRWDVSVILDAAPNATYTWDGMPVTATRSVSVMRQKYRVADAVVTHLGATRRAMALSEPAKPLVHLVHNHRQLFMHDVEPKPNFLALFNSIWMSKATVWDGQRSVLHPIVHAADYEVKPTGDSVVMINRSTSKGVEMFFRLAKANPQYEFVIVRGGYGQQVNFPELLPNLVELDNTESMRSVYKMARVVLMPSLYETWGRVAVEAAASGIPTLGSETHGLAESGVCAGLFPHNEFETWNAGLRLVMDDPDVWRASSDHALERFELLQELSEMEIERSLDLIEAMV